MYRYYSGITAVDLHLFRAHKQFISICQLFFRATGISQTMRDAGDTNNGNKTELKTL